jgi:hypothetical protein
MLAIFVTSGAVFLFLSFALPSLGFLGIKTYLAFITDSAVIPCACLTITTAIRQRVLMYCRADEKRNCSQILVAIPEKKNYQRCKQDDKGKDEGVCSGLVGLRGNLRFVLVKVLLDEPIDCRP